jgi:hypothetical protein
MKSIAVTRFLAGLCLADAYSIVFQLPMFPWAKRIN